MSARTDMAFSRQWIKRRYRELDLLDQYFPLVFTRWQALLWGGSVLAVFWGAHFILGEWPSWINWTAVTVALFFAGYYVWRVDHARLIPQLSVSETNLQHTQVTSTLHSGLGGSDIVRTIDHRTFIQIVPRCLTEAPLYECEGHLKEIRKWCPVQKRWETAEFKSLILKWDNTEDRQITQNPTVEKPLNIAFIRHSDGQVFPCVFGDIPTPRITGFFVKIIGEVEMYEFDIQITYSDRANGEFVSMKPVVASVKVQIASDPFNPSVELTARSSGKCSATTQLCAD